MSAVVACLFVLLVPPESGAAETCSCAHDTAVCVPYDEGGTAKRACVYLLNLHGPDLRVFQQAALKESEVVDLVLRKEAKAKGEEDKRSGTARFFQVANGRIDDERVSSEGILLVRPFVDSGDGTDGSALSFGTLGGLKVKMGTETLTIDASNGGVLPLSGHLDEAKLGEVVEFQLTYGDAKSVSRYSWYRPRTEWVADYALLGLAFSWSSWEFDGEPEVAVIPAMAELEYRYFKPSGGLYVFTSFGIGPNLAFANPGGENPDGTSKGLNGLVGSVSVNVNGFQLGFGTRWAWSSGRFDPMLTLSVTEALARGLNITDKVPDSLFAAQ